MLLNFMLVRRPFFCVVVIGSVQTNTNTPPRPGLKYGNQNTKPAITFTAKTGRGCVRLHLTQPSYEFYIFNGSTLYHSSELFCSAEHKDVLFS